MTDIDTFQTIAYRGVYIHLCYNRVLERQEVRIQGGYKVYSSLEYAKRLIREDKYLYTRPYHRRYWRR